MKQSIEKAEIIRLELKKPNKILTICSLEKKMLNSKIQQTESRRTKKQHPSNNHKKAGVATLLPDKQILSKKKKKKLLEILKVT